MSSALNAAKSRLASVGAALGPYKTIIQLVFYVAIAAIVVFSISTVLFPPPDKFQQVILTDTRGGDELNGLTKQLDPPMSTGGEYSLQLWIFISSWDYKAGQAKHVFSLASDGKPAGGRPEHVSMLGMLYPNENKMMIRVHQDKEGLGAAGAGGGQDFTVLTNIAALYKGTLTPGNFQTTMDYPICDINDIDLQKWVCLSIVVSGRVVDVYVDGKLSRSCVCPGVPIIETGKNSITLCANGGFGGALSTTRFYGYALTPAAVYALYQDGPAEKRGLDKRYGFIGWLAERAGLSIDYQGA
jgi:hypothetical protein